MLNTVKNIVVEDPEKASRKARELTEFGRAIDEATRIDLLADGLATSEHRGVFCMGWIW